MAKKFGKFLLCVSTIGAAFAGAYYFMKAKSPAPIDEDDYEDLDDDSEEDEDDDEEEQPSAERSYVSLNTGKEADSREKAAETVKTDNSSATTVEEFFDDDDDDSDGSLDAI